VLVLIHHRLVYQLFTVIIYRHCDCSRCPSGTTGSLPTVWASSYDQNEWPGTCCWIISTWSS